MRFAQTQTTLDATLTLPLSTGEYTIPAISAKDGLILKELNSAFEDIARRVKAGEDQTKVTEEVVEQRGLTLDDLQNMEELCLSRDVREQMIDDGAGLREVEIAGMTAFLFHTVNDEGKAAEAYWTSGGKSTEGQQGPAANGDPDPTGRGQYDPETGLSDWYEAEGRRAPEAGKRWEDILGHWELIEADLHQHYGIDVRDGILARRSWRWLELRITGLLSIEKSRLRLTLYPPEDPKKHARRKR